MTRAAAAALLAAAGCGLPAVTPTGEPVYETSRVTSVKIDPRTLQPLEQVTGARAGDDASPDERPAE
jgi:hypothetical protein